MNSAKAINRLRQPEKQPLWQKNYYEQIICNQNETALEIEGR